MVPDFSGYVTRYGVKCSDGRTIIAHAFKGQDGAQIPLVWQHLHDDPENVLGHLILEHRDDGVYANAFFNDSTKGQTAKKLVKHGDMTNLSIYANQLKQQGKNVIHGMIREGSLVMAGANPGAYIDNINIQHGDDVRTIDDEALIFNDEALELEHADSSPASDDSGDETVQSVFDSLTDIQKNVVYALIGAALNHSDDGVDSDSIQGVLDTMTEKQRLTVSDMLKRALEHSQSDDSDDDSDDTNDSDSSDDSDVEHSSASDSDDNSNTQKGDNVSRNVFDRTDEKDAKKSAGYHTLTHADRDGIFAAAKKGGSLKDAVHEYCLQHGIDSIDTLFPYDQAVTDTPEFISRRTEWVAGVLAAVRKTPFSRIRSWSADITQDEARAKGYIKGTMKKEEFFGVSRRITTPQTIYKKQKLDRDDILDITDFDVVAWLQTEMRVMLDEELARAILIGDGREVDDPDKINAVNVRPILGDDEMYVTNLNVASSAISNGQNGPDAIVDAVVTGMRFYRGSGQPVMYTQLPYLSKMLLAKDTLGRRLYATKTELAAALGVSAIVPCEVLESVPNLIGIVVNLQDYTCGADKGGQVSMFDFFDIDYNQFKYLMETRMSGAMTKYKGALSVMEFTGAGGTLPDPTEPGFDPTTGVVTIPTVTNVTYVTVASDGTESAALTAGAQAAIASGASVHIRAKAAATYAFADGASEDWVFTRE